MTNEEIITLIQSAFELGRRQGYEDSRQSGVDIAFGQQSAMAAEAAHGGCGNLAGTANAAKILSPLDRAALAARVRYSE